MAEMIEGLAPSANSDLLKFIENLKKANVEIERANRNPIRVGGGRGNNRQALAEIEELNRRLAEQAAAIERLTQARVRSNQRTQDEITNNRLLAQNASLAAQANSTFANSYQRLTAQQAIAARALQDLVARGRTGTQTQREYNAELRNAQTQFTALNTRVLAADRAVGRFNRNVGNYPQQAIRGLKDLVGAFGIVGGVTAFASISKEIFNTTRELQSLDLALTQVLGSTEKAADAQQFLTRISEAYGIEINGLTKSYTGFLAASQNALDANYITAAQINQIFESVSKASGAMGLSVDQQQGAFLALQQMISKGNIQAEEIRGQLAERLPGAFGILAKSMGVTEVQLNKLLKDGKVLAVEVLPAFARELERAYGVENIQRVETLAAGTSRLKNEWTAFVRSLNEGNGVLSKFFTSFLNEARETLKFYKELNTSDRARQESALNEAYRTRLAYLKALDPEQKKLQANDILSVNPQNIKQYEEQNKLLKDRQKILKDDAKELQASDPRQTVGIVKTLNDEYDASTSKIKANATQIAILTGQMRAATEALKGEDKVVKQSLEGNGKVKRQKADIDYLKEVYDLRKANTENELAAQNRLMNNEEKNYSVRLEAANNYYFQKEFLNKLDYEEQLRLNELNFKNQKEQYNTAIKEGKATYSNIQEIQYQHILRKERIDAEYEGKKNELAVESALKLKGVLDSIYDKQKTNIVDSSELDNIRQLNLELANITTGTSYTKFKDIEERKTKITEDANKKRIEIELQRTVDQINALKIDEKNSQVYQDLRGKEIALQKDLAEIEETRLEKSAALTLELKKATDEYIQSISSGFLSDAGLGSLNMFTALDKDGKSPFDKLIEGADSVGEKFAVTFNAIGNVAKETFAFINQNSQAYFDAEASRLQKSYDLEISFNEGSETAKAEIKRQYDEKQRELRRRESQAQKEQALFNIAINTAQGITAALTSTPPNVPLSIIIGAIGVAQAALVAGREIPQYKMGTDNHKGGLAIVGDGGKHELVHQPTLGWSVTPNKDTMVNLEKGSKVFPDLSKVGLFDSGLPDMIKLQGSKMSTSEMDYLAGKLAKVMPRPSNVSVLADKNGISSYITTAGGKSEDRNRVLSIGGKRV